MRQILNLHCKVVHLIRNYYPKSLIVAALGENQDTPFKRIDSWEKGYTKGQPDLLVVNYHKDYNGLCIEFKSPTNNYQILDAQREMKKRCEENCYQLILSNDYDHICKKVHNYMVGIRVPCKYFDKAFLNKETRKTHYQVIHRITK